MSVFIFDLDGTLANIDHRLHFLEKNDWRGFFKACIYDEPVESVIQILRDLVMAGHEVQIWSGRSAEVVQETYDWLDRHIGSFPGKTFLPNELLKHMRKEGDYTKDFIIKEEWLNAFHQERGHMPTMIFDDRPSVVDMWRKNGVTCAQVATWDDRKRNITPHKDHTFMLTLMIGPSGAGKSTVAAQCFNSSWIVSSDRIRIDLCGTMEDQSRNKEVFQAVHALVETRLKSGLPVVVDATNLHAKDRKVIVDIANKVDGAFKIQYLVVDRPLEEKQKTGGWRNSVEVKGEPLIKRHHDIFQQVRKDVMRGDGLDNVIVNEWEW